MYLDALTVSALVDSFLDRLVGGRIQDVIDVDENGLGLEIYASQRRHYLYMSADPQRPRVQLMPEKLRRGLQRPTQLGLVFRSYVEDGLLVHASQPPWERVLYLDVEGPKGDVTIVVEPMERRSNLLLVQDGIIVDCIRRVGPEENRYRLSLPKHEYVPPPPMTGRYDPFTLTLEDLIGILEQGGDSKNKTAALLSRRVLGFSPLLAQEIVFRACGDAGQPAAAADPAALLDQIRQVMEPLARREWHPGVAEEEGQVTAFSVYPLQSLPGWRPVATISEALGLYYGAAVGPEAYQAAKRPVLQVIHDAQGRLRGKLASLESGLKDDRERELLRQSGDLILAYQYTLEAGQRELRAVYDPEGPELVVALDPELTPLENANRYFEKYNKAKRALDEVPDRIEATRMELAYLEQLENDLELARNWPDIDEVQQALQAMGYGRGTIKRLGGGGSGGPLRLTTQDGYVVWVGRNSRQNELVTFKNARPQDLWLHARGVPGAHVVIRDDGRRIPETLIEQAAAVAAHYSKLRGEGSVIVDVTHRKYVKKIGGAGPGMVTYRNERTVTVAPHDESILNRE